MNLNLPGGYEIALRKKALIPSGLTSVSSRGGWWPIIRESFSGAWQQNTEVSLTNVLTNPIVYACISLISRDVSKLELLLMQQDRDDIWVLVENPAYTPVLRKPNRYQAQIQFLERWMLSKLIHGNTYVLKARDARQVVTALYILDPGRTKPLVAPDGSVFYALKTDNLTGVQQDVIVPASEIIHDRMNCLYHDLVGIPPLSACGLAATQGIAIRDRSTLFFENGSTPGGIVMVPGFLDQTQLDTIKSAWEDNYGGDNQGKVAVLSQGMDYKPILPMSATDSQLTEQQKEAALEICSAFLVPPYKVGVGPMPTYNNVQALNTEYFGNCIQWHVESIEDLLDEGLGILTRVGGVQYGVQFDVDGLLRMDTLTLVETLSKEVGAGIVAPNEARKKRNRKPVDGGDTPYLQQQNFSLAALDKRDSQADPFASKKTETPAPAQMPAETPAPAKAFDMDAFASHLIRKMAA